MAEKTHRFLENRWGILNFVAAIVSMIVFVSFIGVYLQQQLLDNLQSSTEVMFSAVYDSVDNELQQISELCENMSHDPFLIAALEDEEQDQEKFRQNVSSYLSDKTQLFDLSTAYVVSDRSMRYYLPDGSDAVLDPEANEWDNWYTALMESDDEYHVDVDVDKHNTGEWTIFIDWRIRDAQGNNLGLTGVGIDSDALMSLARRYADTFDAKVSFVSADGTAYIGSDESEITEAQRNVSPEDAGRMAIELADGKCVATRYLPFIDWALVVETDQGSIADAMHGLAGLGAALFALSLAVIVFLNNRLFTRERRKLTARANTDALTGLRNRAGVEEGITAYLSESGDKPVAAMVAIDLDHFKDINDTFGHNKGDQVLCDIAAVLRQVFRGSDIIGRPGGDEFVAFLPAMSSREIIEARIQDLCERCRLSYPSDNGDIRISLSAGIAMAPDDGTTYADLSRAADGALYEVKRSGRDGYRFAS